MAVMGQQGRSQPGRHPSLGKNARQVLLHRALPDPQPAPHRAIRSTAAQQQEHLPLTPRQPLQGPPLPHGGIGHTTPAPAHSPRTRLRFHPRPLSTRQRPRPAVRPGTPRTAPGRTTAPITRSATGRKAPTRRSPGAHQLQPADTATHVITATPPEPGRQRNASRRITLTRTHRPQASAHSPDGKQATADHVPPAAHPLAQTRPASPSSCGTAGNSAQPNPRPPEHRHALPRTRSPDRPASPRRSVPLPHRPGADRPTPGQPQPPSPAAALRRRSPNVPARLPAPSGGTGVPEPAGTNLDRSPALSPSPDTPGPAPPPGGAERPIIPPFGHPLDGIPHTAGQFPRRMADTHKITSVQN